MAGINQVEFDQIFLDWYNPLRNFVYYKSGDIQVAEEIERQFNVKFATQDFEHEFFTGSFTSKDLRSALDIVCVPMGLNYEIGRNKKIFITEIKK